MARTRKPRTDEPSPPVRIGLIAPAEVAVAYTAVLASGEGLQLSAQGGLPQTAAADGVPWFDDLRVMIAQAPLDALVLAVSPRLGTELAPIAAGAAEHGRHVWRPPPLARNFSEAVELVRRMQATDVVFRVGSWWEHVYEAVVGAVGRAAPKTPDDDDRPDELPAITLSDVDLSAAGPELGAWWSSAADAGGGVLMADAYEMLEALVAMRGLPDTVFGAIGKCRSKTASIPRETEDFAEALLRYADGGVARVSARWDVPPLGKSSVHCGPTASVQLRADCVEVRDAAGAIVGAGPLPDGYLAAELERFAHDVRSGATGEELAVIINRHLAVSAIIDATYLSSRTGQPESPRRLYEAQKCEDLIP